MASHYVEHDAGDKEKETVEAMDNIADHFL